MKKVFIYQIVDDCSENILQNFIGPNDVFAEKVFANFCNSKGMKNADLDDIYMIRQESNAVFETYSDFKDVIHGCNPAYQVWYGSDFLEDDENEG